MKKKVDVDNKITNYVESFFEELHYSKEIESAKEKIISKLNDEYLNEKEKDKRNAFKKFVKKYSSLEEMLNSIGIDNKKLEKWFDKDVSMDFNDFKIEFKKESIFI